MEGSLEGSAGTSAVVVAFRFDRLEAHVRKALQAAWRLSQGQPLTARQLLRGALVVAPTVRSEAFRKFASLCPLKTRESPSTSKRRLPPLDVGAIPVVRPLSRALSTAQAFFGNKGGIWGRDYITLALLADDPSLELLASESNLELDTLRSQWLDFLRTSSRHRKPEEWERWFKSALASGPQAGASTEAYLLTWNPARYFEGRLAPNIQALKEQGSTTLRWSTGNRKDMPQGSRVFLLRQGVEPRGLVGVGTVQGPVMEEPHWNPAQRALGRTSLLVDVQWHALAAAPFVSRTRLIDQLGANTESLWSTKSGGVSVPSEVAAGLEALWPAAWERHKQGLGEDYTPALEPKKLVAQLSPDTGDAPDSMNVDRYVDAFARVMSSRAAVTPLSIGLFGDWGSGKTFFMKRLYERIEALSQEVQDEQLYWSNICQIRFNAWHYAETELWASLVSEIFRQLRVYLDRDDPDSDEFNRLLQHLELAGELRNEAQARHAAAIQAHEDATQRLAEADQALQGAAELPALSDEREREVLRSSLVELLPRSTSLVALLQAAAELSGRDDFGRAAEQLDKKSLTVQEARSVLQDASALGNHVGLWWRVLSRAKLTRTPGFRWTVAAMVAIPLLAFAAQRFWTDLGGFAHVWAILCELATVLGAGLAWLRGRMAAAGPLFDRFDAAARTVDQKLEEARRADRAVHEAAVADARTAEARARTELEEAKVALRQAEADREAASTALRDSTSQARLGRFIRDRAGAADYEQHLGLIAMIRRDFERLSDLMAKVQAQPQEVDPSLPRVDRIILYIDDLDRCHPPERVVRVLEAVHLLLFFPLFVVVVGVDSRWVSRALCKYYEGMLADEAMGDNGDKVNAWTRAPADSQDFLEKIFQVPFWLRRMDRAAVRRMIHNLISEDELVEPLPEPSGLDDDADGGGMDDSAEGIEAEAETDLSERSEVVQHKGRAAAKRVAFEAEGEAEMIGEPLAAPTERLTLTRAELDYMDQVAPLMPRTPRSVKRFVNIYRLYKAGLSTPGLATFLGTSERPGNFRAVQVLLALVTGAPRAAKRIFDELHRDEAGDSRPLLALVDALGGPPKGDHLDEVWSLTYDALREFAQQESSLSCDDLRAVAHVVTRYSVHHMVSQAPGQSEAG